MNNAPEKTENILLTASAGTGKTFTLATFMILLLAQRRPDGTGPLISPNEIIALTFSRDATREIFSKLASRLAAAAAGPEGARKEIAGNLRPAVEKYGLSCPELTQADFVAILRRVLAVQNVGAVSTLDSFILRIIRSIPLELGFQNGVGIIDDYAEGQEIRDACDALLGDAARRDQISALLRAMEGDKDVRSVSDGIDDLIKSWRGVLASGRIPAADISLAAMERAIGLPAAADLAAVVRDLETALSAHDAQTQDLLSDLVEFLRSYDGSDSVIPPKGFGKKCAEQYLQSVGDAALASVKFGRTVYDLGPRVAELLRSGFDAALRLYLERRIRTTVSVLGFMALLELRYDRDTRAAGKLTFADLTDVLGRRFAAFAGGDPAGRPARFAAFVKDVQYRFDVKLNHWMLDEFQDTSLGQWGVLSGLVQNAASAGGGRTVAVVGDPKQAIYGWRGGSLRPFNELAASGAYTPRSLDKSFRYGPAVCDFVNAVFGADVLGQSFGAAGANASFSPDRSAVVKAAWLDKFPKHEPDEGRKDPGTVRIVDFEKPDPGADTPSFESVVCAEVKRILAVQKAQGVKKLDVAVLVRKNKQGEAMAAALKAAGIGAVWEGESAVCDSPVVQAFLALLHLSEHPEDGFDRRLATLTPLAATLFPGLGVEAVAARVARDLSRLGLARTLQDYVKAFRDPKTAASLGEFTNRRLDSLVRAAVAFEALDDAAKGVSDFPEFLDKQTSRDFADSSKVKVVTIHRSKGLTFDCVVLPVMEDRLPFAEPDPREPLLGDGWALPHLPRELAASARLPTLRAAWNEQCDTAMLDSLRMWYVAVTRAKYELVLVLPPPPGEKSNHEKFSLLVRDAVASLGGNPAAPDHVLLENGAKADWILPAVAAEQKTKSKSQAAEPPPADWAKLLANPSARPVVRITPSHAAGGGVGPDATAGALFSEDYGAGAAHGIEVHEAYARLEWPEEAEFASNPLLKGGLAVAFRKPVDLVELWRERNYELFNAATNTWESGQFDRVVFTGAGAARSATVYDFKTDAHRSPEQMVAAHADQMRHYREAVSALTGIPPSRVKTVLLSTVLAEAIPVPSVSNP